jgi:hypothetical protein
VNLPVDFHRVAPIAAIGLVAIVAGLLVVRGLGGSSGSSASTGPAKVLDQTFSGRGASSGKFQATAAVALQGVPAPAANPFMIEAAGRFDKGASGAPAKFELDATVTAVGQKQSSHLVSTGQQAYLTAGGLTQQLPAGSGATTFAVNPRSWLQHPVDAGTAQVDGVTTQHVSADVDVAKMFNDLQAAAPKSGAAGQTGLTDVTQKTLRDSVKGARADVYTGTSDHVLRRLTVTGTFQATSPSIPAASPNSSKINGRLVFDLRIADVGKPQSIAAPRSRAPHPVKKPHGGRSHARPKPAGTPKPAAGQTRSAQGYVSCVQAAQDLQALARCQALAPRR